MELHAHPYRGDEDYWRIRAFLREVLPLYGMYFSGIIPSSPQTGDFS